MGKFVRGSNNLPEESYDILNEPLSVHKSIMDLLLKDKQYSNLIALYMFYYHTAKWQKTNIIKAINYYTALTLGWGEGKIIETRKRLKEYGLIEDVHRRDNLKQKFTGHFIKVNLSLLYTPRFEQDCQNRGEYSLKKSIIVSRYPTPATDIFKENEDLPLIDQEYHDQANELITPSMFDKFWKLYPKKVNYKKAQISWRNACKLPKEQRPTLHQVLKAILSHTKSQQWQNKTFIPMPTTWLNQGRWHDDPKDLIVYNNSSKNERYECPYGLKYGSSFSRGKEGCQRCEDEHQKIWIKCKQVSNSL